MLTTAQLAEKISARLEGNGSIEIKSISPVEVAADGDVTFITDDKYLDFLKSSGAVAVITNKPIDKFGRPQLIVKNVGAALITALKLFAPKLAAAKPGIHPTCVLGENVKIADSASIGPNVSMADNVTIADNVILGAGVRIGENSIIGENTRLDANVVVYHNCKIGSGVVIQANTTIGSTGFGYMPVDGRPVLVPHNGGVVIEDFVEIGANCSVDRAKFGDTVIGAGTKIDNLVQIAHNVIIGKCCLIAGQCGIAGSSKLGDGVVLAGQVGMVDNITIGDGVLVGAQAGVMRNTPAGKRIVGSPAIDYTEKIRQIALTQKLPQMAERLKKLTKRIDSLETSEDDKK